MTPTEQQLTDWGFEDKGKVNPLSNVSSSIYSKRKNYVFVKVYVANSGNIIGVYVESAPAKNCTSLPSLQVLLHLFDMI